MAPDTSAPTFDRATAAIETTHRRQPETLPPVLRRLAELLDQVGRR